MNDIKYPLYEDPLFSRAKRLDNYNKLKKSYLSICQMIEEWGNKTELKGIPRGPREDLMKQYDKHSIIIWQRQKLRLEERLSTLEKEIQKDIEDSKRE